MKLIKYQKDGSLRPVGRLGACRRGRWRLAWQSARSRARCCAVRTTDSCVPRGRRLRQRARQRSTLFVARATKLAGGAASSGGSVQGACGTIIMSLREGVGAGVEAKAFLSMARRAGEVGGRAGVTPAPLAAAGAPASAPAANAGGSEDSKLTTPGGISKRIGFPSAVASIARCSPKSKKQEKSRLPSVDCSSGRPGLMRRSSLTVNRPSWLIQGTYSFVGPATMRGQRHVDGHSTARGRKREHRRSTWVAEGPTRGAC